MDSEREQEETQITLFGVTANVLNTAVAEIVTSSIEKHALDLNVTIRETEGLSKEGSEILHGQIKEFITGAGDLIKVPLDNIRKRLFEHMKIPDNVLLGDQKYEEMQVNSADHLKLLEDISNLELRSKKADVMKLYLEQELEMHKSNAYLKDLSKEKGLIANFEDATRKEYRILFRR